jgi:hypothetical protein
VFPEDVGGPFASAVVQPSIVSLLGDQAATMPAATGEPPGPFRDRHDQDYTLHL